MTKLFECYVANPTHDEAVEIVERLIANGAVAYDVVEGMYVGGRREHAHDDYGCWGYNLKTYTGVEDAKWTSRSKQLTMQEFRAAFPCEKYDSPAEEWPQLGARVEVFMGTFSSDRRQDGETATVLSVALNSKSSHIAMIEIDGKNGECDALLVECLRPIKSDREKFIEAALEVVKARQWTTEELLEELYDADFKAPEKDND